LSLGILAAALKEYAHKNVQVGASMYVNFVIKTLNRIANGGGEGW
jgi:hypothetical protein